MITHALGKESTITEGIFNNHLQMNRKLELRRE